jgi:hypothetical protein
MTTHDIPHRRRGTTLVAGATVAIGLVVAVGLQMSGESLPATAVASGHRLDCPAPIAP